MKQSRHLGILLAALVLAIYGCSTSSPPETVDGLDTVADATEIIAVDVVLQDTGGHQPEALDLAQTADSPEAVDTQFLGCDPGEGCFMDKCSQNADCQSSWCVEHLGEGVCSMTCEEECPPGWVCRNVTGASPDIVWVCVSNHANLCKPCSSTTECKGAGGVDDLCIDYGDEGSFCGGQCTDDAGCPWGFSCLTTDTIDGISTLQCVADAGVCPCTGKSVDLALWTPCEVTSEFGTCPGKRICTGEGLLACDALEPAAETCNGLDDDCDGEADNPLLVEGDYINVCDDENDCTIDTCKGEVGCDYETLSEGECVDGDACTIGDHCEEGVCVGLPIACDDENPCTDDSCDGLGGCINEFNLEPCDDGDPCTVADQCDDGECLGFAIPCDCQSEEDCAALEDGDLCNGTLTCTTEELPYQCEVEAGTIVECLPVTGMNAPCLLNDCDPGTGECETLPANDGHPCDDEDACTVGDKCEAGVCVFGVPMLCNDGNHCTDDSCDSGLGCEFAPNAGPCSDDDVCTVGDGCADGQCVSGADELPCDDGNPCTAGACDTAVGCVHTADDQGLCDDGNACTTGDHCSLGNCVYAGGMDCDDDQLCTTDSCAPATGCVHSLNDVPCDDDSVCTTGDHCHLGQCIGAGVLVCEDKNACTNDSCNPLLGCEFEANDDPCDDGTECTVSDACAGGSCQPGVPLNCDDGNPCTANTCDSLQGCVTTPLAGACDDGNACTEGESCAQAVCGGGAPVNCNDGEVCTTDTCDNLAGCLNVPNDLMCDDQSLCTDGDYCDTGVCAPGALVDCDDENPCTDDSCAALTGCGSTPVDDGTPCGGVLICVAGVCSDACEEGSQVFSFSGAVQTFVVPTCATSVKVEAYGGGGGNGWNQDGGGSVKGMAGKGGFAQATVVTTPGETLFIYVGGKGEAAVSNDWGEGGWNGGGNGWVKSGYYGGGGGGASDVRKGGETLGHRVVVAGGGGAGSGWCTAGTGNGGNGGGNSGTAGQVCSGITAGQGGTQNSGGLIGGNLGQGGNASDNAGAGGGGGYYGGGASNGSGGGGGSGHVGALGNALMQTGVNSGDGSITLTW